MVLIDHGNLCVNCLCLAPQVAAFSGGSNPEPWMAAGVYKCGLPGQFPGGSYEFYVSKSSPFLLKGVYALYKKV